PVVGGVRAEAGGAGQGFQLGVAIHGARLSNRSSGTMGEMIAVISALLLATGGADARVAPPAPPLPLGVSYSGWRGGFADAPARLAQFRAVGFPIVTFIPAYAYVGRNKIDRDSGPTAEELGRAVELALRDGRTVVIKPHLEPPLHQPGYKRAQSDNHSWRAECGW